MFNFFVILGVLFLSNCATQLNITTSPEKAEVFAVSKDRSKLMGQTPLIIKPNEIEDLDSLATFLIQKEGYVPYYVMVPVTFLKDQSSIKVSLKQVREWVDLEDRVIASKIAQISKRYAQVQALMHAGQMDQAQKIANELALKYSGISTSWIFMGNVYYAKRDYNNARISYLKALTLDPGDREIEKMVQTLDSATGHQSNLPKAESSNSTNSGETP